MNDLPKNAKRCSKMAHNGGYKATLEVMHGKVELDIFQLGEHGARRFKKTSIIGEGESYIIKLK